VDLRKDVKVVHQQLRTDEPTSLPSFSDPASLGSAAISILGFIDDRTPELLEKQVNKHFPERKQQLIRETLGLTEHLGGMLAVDEGGISFEEDVSEDTRERLKKLAREIYTPDSHAYQAPPASEIYNEDNESG
jgi:hypothetical protein